MDGKDGLHIAEKLAAAETVFQVHRDQTCLPVMTMHHIRLEPDHRQSGKGRVAEEGKLLQVIEPIPIWLRAGKITFVVNKIEMDPLMLVVHDAHIAALAHKVHIKMAYIVHLVTPLLLNAEILGDHNPHIIVLFIKTLGQRANNVCQSPGLNKRHCL